MNFLDQQQFVFIIGNKDHEISLCIDHFVPSYFFTLDIAWNGFSNDIEN